MANHGYVKTRKLMTPEKISELLAELNVSHFKGLLKFEYSNESGNPSAWGPHVWLVRYIGKGLENEIIRVFWLNTKRSFEIRHGGGSNFYWWIDSVIINEVALKFDGTISDDGCGDKWKGKPNYCREFIEFQKKMMRFDFAKDDVERQRKIAFMQMEQDDGLVPPDFHTDLGPKIEICIQQP